MLPSFLGVPIVSAIVGLNANEFQPVNIWRLATLIRLEQVGDALVQLHQDRTVH